MIPGVQRVLLPLLLATLLLKSSSLDVKVGKIEAVLLRCARLESAGVD